MREVLRQQRVVVLLALALFAVRGVEAQQPPAPPDSTPRDSGRQAADNWLLLPVIGAFMSVLATAPPALLLLKSHLTMADSLGGIRDKSLSLFLTGGATAEIPALAYSGSIQLLDRHFYATLAHEEFFPRARGRFVSARAGYLLRPLSPYAGGVTIGYRRTYAPTPDDAVEVGLPLLMGDSRRTALFEPTYVIWGRGVKWTYRFQGTFSGLPRPLVAGFLLEAQPIRGGVSGVYALLLGARF